MATVAPPSRVTDRFWSRVTIVEDDRCWVWTGYQDEDGYGILKIGGRHQRAHRVAWTLTNGPIPHGSMVLHRCNNPACCNPSHLYPGSAAENAADREAARRARPVTGQLRLAV